MEKKGEEKKTFKLPNKKVTIRLVDRKRGAIADKNHVGYNLLPGATIEISPRNKKGERVVKCPLTREEIEFFEDKRKSGMAFSEGDLSPYADDRINHWRKREAKVILDSNPVELDLSDGADYIKWKTLLSNDDLVAPDSASEFAKKSYIFVLESNEEVEKKVVVRGDKKKRAWKLAAKMENDKQGMIDFLSVVGKRPSASSKIGFLVSAVDAFVEDNIDEFLTVLEDDKYETRILLTKAVQAKAVKKDGYKYYLEDGTELCKRGEVNNLTSALEFLSAIENQDISLMLEAKVNK